jgi:hypothetical protein
MYLNLIKSLEKYEKENLLYTDDEINLLVLNNPENTYLKERIEYLNDKYENPYIKLLEWIEEEELDIEAILETIEDLNYLNRQYEKLYKQKEDNELDIKSVKITYSIKSIFSFKTEDEEKKKLDERGKNIEKELKEYLDLIKICHFIMEKFIQEFKELKIKSYYKYLKFFSISLKMNNTILNDLLNCIEKDKNLIEYFD